MDQYHPAGKVLQDPARYPELARRLREGEHLEALRLAHEAGLRRIDERHPHPRLRLRVF